MVKLSVGLGQECSEGVFCSKTLKWSIHSVAALT